MKSYAWIEALLFWVKVGVKRSVRLQLTQQQKQKQQRDRSSNCNRNRHTDANIRLVLQTG